MIDVLFDNRQDFIEITQNNENAIKKAIETVLEVEEITENFEVSVSFVTNEEIKELNKTYRNVDSETDVLSFPMIDEFDEVEDFYEEIENDDDFSNLDTTNNTMDEIDEISENFGELCEYENDGFEILGDIIISTQKIIEQAEDFSHSLEREMIYLTVHSMFHLLGYDHMEDEEKEEMRSKEKEVMKKLNIFK